MATYSEKLKDPRWQKKRLEVLDRCDWACELCGAKDKTLHVHHGHYRKDYEPWDYESNTLHTVCVDCHDEADCIRTDLQFEVAQLPLPTQRQLLLYAAFLNCLYEDDADSFLNEAINTLQGI